MLLSISRDIVFDSNVFFNLAVNKGVVCVFVFVVRVNFTCTFTCYVYLSRFTFTCSLYDSLLFDVLSFDSTSYVLGRLRVTFYVLDWATRRRRVEATE